MIESCPFWAPAWPPETGASTKPTPISDATAAISLATSAEAVVWSTSVEPSAMPARAPSSPKTTNRRSSSLPTQTITASAPVAASRGVGTEEPPWASTHASALEVVRL